MTRVDTLLAAMTLEEKIGRLNMAAAGHAVTGPALASGAIEGIRAGRIGSLLYVWGAREVHAVKKIAVEKARLGIPLLIGYDVLHGHRTIFPIPLAEAASFDPRLRERSACEAAIEAAADGISMTVLKEGPAAGEATIILFVRDMVASVARPLLELKGVGKVAPGPGEGGTVCFRLAAAALAVPGSDLKPVLEPNFCFLPGKAPIRGQMLTIKVRSLPG